MISHAQNMTQAQMDNLLWVHAFPDPTTRAHWVAEFSDHLNLALTYAAHFTDPAAAAAWSSQLRLPPADAAHLHAHGIQPADTRTIADALDEAGFEHAIHGVHHGDRSHTEIRLRATYALTHPALTATDRTAITRAAMDAGAARTEIDHLIATGTFGPATLTTLGALA